MAPKRKRLPKASVACESCRRIKSKCNQEQPCAVCAENSWHCIYRRKLKATTSAANTAGRVGNYVSIAARPQASNQQPHHLQSPSSVARLSTSIGISQPATAKGHCQLSPPELCAPEREKSATGCGSDEGADAPPNPNGFGEMNKHTKGIEFYGPTATLAFLLELRSRTMRFLMRNAATQGMSLPSERIDSLEPEAIVNLFYPSSDDNLRNERDHSDAAHTEIHGQLKPSHQQSMTPSPVAYASPSPLQQPPDIEIEKECASLYFGNLHLVYCFMDQASFFARCQSEMWSPSRSARPSHSRFTALYYALLAVGAVTAGDDALVGRGYEHLRKYLAARTEQLRRPLDRQHSVYPPLELAQFFLGKAKAHSEDYFEASSLDAVQTLFLMSIFCQYTLKPHAAYMYSAMAVRMACAIGIVNEPDVKKNPLHGIHTWWCLYYHEMELSCSLGRESSLKDVNHYPIYAVKWGDPMPLVYFGGRDEQCVFFARATTQLASLLNRASANVNKIRTPDVDMNEQSMQALLLDQDLLKWKSQLSPVFDLDEVTLTESEVVTKRKIILQMRFNSARILIHRPFLVAAAKVGSIPYEENIKLCVEASIATIQLLYDNFANRPFFRTWLYNTAHALNAATVILYALICQLQRDMHYWLIQSIEKSLEIFQAMNGIAVARRCAQLTRDIFLVAKASATSHNALHSPVQNSSLTDDYQFVIDGLGQGVPGAAGREHSSTKVGAVTDESPGSVLFNEDLFADLLHSGSMNLDGTFMAGLGL